MLATSKVKRPLTNVQLELLKVFSYDLEEAELIEFRRHIAQFFAERLMEKADEVWTETDLEHPAAPADLIGRMIKQNPTEIDRQLETLRSWT